MVPRTCISFDSQGFNAQKWNAVRRVPFFEHIKVRRWAQQCLTIESQGTVSNPSNSGRGGMKFHVFAPRRKSVSWVFFGTQGFELWPQPAKMFLSYLGSQWSYLTAQNSGRCNCGTGRRLRGSLREGNQNPVQKCLPAAAINHLAHGCRSLLSRVCIIWLSMMLSTTFV